MIEVRVNGRAVQVKPGTTVLQACEKAGVEIPRFCYHETLLVAGNCRMCLVEIAGSPKPQASCALPVSPGLKVLTDTERVKKARESVMEFRLLNHPLDCPICDQGGECDLQDQSRVYGSDRSRRHEPKRGVEDKNLGPIVKTVMTRCIHCTRCIRFASEIAGVADLGTSARGNETEVGTYVDKVLKTELSGNLVDLCPVGALTAKPSAFQARPWELASLDSVDGRDGTGASIRVQHRGGDVLRILPRRHDAVNGEWLADKSRHALDGRAQNRQLTARVHNKGKGRLPKRVSREDMLDHWHAYILNVLTGERVKERRQVVVSPTVDVRRRRTLSRLQHAFHVRGQGHRFELTVVGSSTSPVTSGVYAPLGRGMGVAGRKDADRVVRLDVNPRREAPLVNIRRREGFLQGKRNLVSVGSAVSLTRPTEHRGGSVMEVRTGRRTGSTEGGLLLRDKRRGAERPVRRRGQGRAARRDYSAILTALISVVGRREAEGRVEAGWSVLHRLHAHTNSRGAESLGLPRFQGWKPGHYQFYVGTSTAERKEAGYLENFRFRDLRAARVSHQDSPKLADAWLTMPRPVYTESTEVYVNTEGRVGATRGRDAPEISRKWGLMDTPTWMIEVQNEELGIASGEDEGRGSATTAREGVTLIPDRRGEEDSASGLRAPRTQTYVAMSPKGWAWGRATDSVPRVHDYYREGHPVARHSVTMANCSRSRSSRTCFDEGAR